MHVHIKRIDCCQPNITAPIKTTSRYQGLITYKYNCLIVHVCRARCSTDGRLSKLHETGPRGRFHVAYLNLHAS